MSFHISSQKRVDQCLVALSLFSGPFQHVAVNPQRDLGVSSQKLGAAEKCRAEK
jgi:hypothetical protein